MRVLMEMSLLSSNMTQKMVSLDVRRHSTVDNWKKGFPFLFFFVLGPSSEAQGLFLLLKHRKLWKQRIRLCGSSLYPHELRKFQSRENFPRLLPVLRGFPQRDQKNRKKFIKALERRRKYRKYNRVRIYSEVWKVSQEGDFFSFLLPERKRGDVNVFFFVLRNSQKQSGKDIDSFSLFF